MTVLVVIANPKNKMKKYLNIDQQQYKDFKYNIAFYTIVILIALVIAIISCGDGPHKKRKGEWKKHQIEYKYMHHDSIKAKRVKIWMERDTIHSDSAKQVRRKLWKKRMKQRKSYKK